MRCIDQRWCYVLVCAGIWKSDCLQQRGAILLCRVPPCVPITGVCSRVTAVSGLWFFPLPLADDERRGRGRSDYVSTRVIRVRVRDKSKATAYRVTSAKWSASALFSRHGL